MALGYLLDPFIQINNVNGTPIVGAKIYVYNADTTNLATTYNDFEGHLNTNPVITDDLGNATIIADDGIEYDVSVHDENDLLLFTKKNISIDKTSSAGGNIQVAPGYGVTVERVGNVFTVSVDTDLIATKEDLAEKQDKLTGGDNIEITNDNTVNVVNRKELAVQYPLRINRTNNRVKLYLDSDFSNEFKTKQTPVEYGGASGNYISYITQNENGEIEATVQETVLPSFDDIHAGDNISITRTGNDLTISGKDWTNTINSAVSSKLDTSTYNTFVNSTNAWDKTPYTAGTGISVSNHVISCTGDITPYTAGTGISISNHAISCTAITAPIYLDSYNFPTIYSFSALDGQSGSTIWLNVPDALTYNGIVKDNNKQCYSLVDQSSYKMCEVDADFVIRIDAMPSNSSVIDIEYGAKETKSMSSNSLRNIIFYATGIYYIHYHCIFTAKDFYFCGANRSYLVGGGTASIYLQNVTIRSL